MRTSQVLSAHERAQSRETKPTRSHPRRLYIVIKTILRHLECSEVRVQTFHRAPIIVVSVDQAREDAVAAALDLGVKVGALGADQVLIVELVGVLPGGGGTGRLTSPTADLERLALRAQLRCHACWVWRPVVVTVLIIILSGLLL